MENVARPESTREMAVLPRMLEAKSRLFGCAMTSPFVVGRHPGRFAALLNLRWLFGSSLLRGSLLRRWGRHGVRRSRRGRGAVRRNMPGRRGWVRRLFFLLLRERESTHQRDTA